MPRCSRECSRHRSRGTSCASKEAAIVRTAARRFSTSPRATGAAKSRLHRTAKIQVEKSLQYAYRDRKQRKRQFRSLVDHPHQRGGAAQRHQLFGADRRPQERRLRPRPQGPRRHRGARPAGLHPARRAVQTSRELRARWAPRVLTRCGRRSSPTSSRPGVMPPRWRRSGLPMRARRAASSTS